MDFTVDYVGVIWLWDADVLSKGGFAIDAPSLSTVNVAWFERELGREPFDSIEAVFSR